MHLSSTKYTDLIGSILEGSGPPDDNSNENYGIQLLDAVDELKTVLVYVPDDM